MVWSCAGSAAISSSPGKKVEVPRLDCSSRANTVIFWSGSTRPVHFLAICSASCSIGPAHSPTRCCGVRSPEVTERHRDARRGDRRGAPGPSQPAARRRARAPAPDNSRLAVPTHRALRCNSRWSSAWSCGHLGAALGRAGGQSVGIWRCVRTSGWARVAAWHLCSVVNGGWLLAANTISPSLPPHRQARRVARRNTEKLIRLVRVC